MLHTQNLAYRYPKAARAIAFPDLELAQGEGLLLLGPSGSGKSTLLALIAGLVLPSLGRLSVANSPIHDLPSSQRDRWRGHNLGFLPQRLHLPPTLTVWQNLEMTAFAAAQPFDEAKAQTLLAELGLAHLAQRRPGQLSGGQMQRVALARALLLSPRLVLADEPSSHLDDDAARSALHTLFSACQRRGASWVLATHDRRVAPAAQALGLRFQTCHLQAFDLQVVDLQGVDATEQTP